MGGGYVRSCERQWPPLTHNAIFSRSITSSSDRISVWIPDSITCINSHDAPCVTLPFPVWFHHRCFWDCSWSFNLQCSVVLKGELMLNVHKLSERVINKSDTEGKLTDVCDPASLMSFNTVCASLKKLYFTSKRPAASGNSDRGKRWLKSVSRVTWWEIEVWRNRNWK